MGNFMGEKIGVSFETVPAREKKETEVDFESFVNNNVNRSLELIKDKALRERAGALLKKIREEKPERRALNEILDREYSDLYEKQSGFSSDELAFHSVFQPFLEDNQRNAAYESIRSLRSAMAVDLVEAERSKDISEEELRSKRNNADDFYRDQLEKLIGGKGKYLY